jgi:hypothetical protein
MVKNQLSVFLVFSAVNENLDEIGPHSAGNPTTVQKFP